MSKRVLLDHDRRTTEKDCGSCKVCCFAPRIKETNKPVMEWCQYCDPKAEKGCTVYQWKTLASPTGFTRPQACEDFRCLWIRDRGMDMDDSLRPDKCRVMFVAREPSGGEPPKLVVFQIIPGAIRKKKIDALITRALMAGTKIILYTLGKQDPEYLELIDTEAKVGEPEEDTGQPGNSGGMVPHNSLSGPPH